MKNPCEEQKKQSGGKLESPHKEDYVTVLGIRIDRRFELVRAHSSVATSISSESIE